MTDLPVREMVLYKHGVGFFVRQGEFSGTEATLNFRAEEVNDILKSLAVFDRAGGQVYGVHYQTPMDRAHRLANTSIRLGNNASITQLLQQLRGRQVTLVVEDNKGKQLTYTGRIIGTEGQPSSDNHGTTSKHYVSMLTNDGATHIFPFDSIRQFTIKDEQSKQDLTYFLDTSMSEDNRRAVTVRMSEGAHDLVVHYVAPSPTWRVSYRLVAEANDTGNTGKALLQGWGLFDNRFEEDLNEVKVTLVAGQPISFIYDLYESVIPQRPIVKDEARIVDAPVEYKAERKRLSAKAAPAGAVRSAIAAMERAEADDEAYGYNMSLDAFAQSTAISTETRETGETFQYSVSTPVTIKRGESALVPIIGETVNYERELLYNSNKLADHPVASLRFENQTGMTLERGPVTVVEDGDYRGEAIIPFTRDNSVVYVPYAVELGVNVKEEFHATQELRGISIDNQLIKHQVYFIHQTTYTIENTTTSDKVVTIEAPKQDLFELFDMAEPDAETLNERRWKVPVNANRSVEFIRKERQMQWQTTRIRDMKYRDLEAYLENKYIDKTMIADLREILDAVQSVNDMNQKISQLEQERQTVYDKQDQFRKNMESLGSAGKEGTLRQRVVDQLEASQDRLEAIDAEIEQIKSNRADTEANIKQMIKALGEK